jgi:hypothetical protein
MARVSLSHNGQTSPSGIIMTNAFVTSQKMATRIDTMTAMKIAASVQLQRPGIR